MRPHFDWSPRLDTDPESPEPEPGPEPEPELPPALEHDDTIRVEAELAEELAAPRSRPTLSDTPRALHPSETDDEHDFFLAGEEGRYEGGPATLVPLAIDEVEAAERPRLPPPDPAVLARRGRNVRVVSSIVGAMAAIFAVGLVRSNATAQSPSDPVEVAAQPAPVQIAKAPAPKPTAPIAKAPEPAAAPEPEPAAAPEPEPVKLAAAPKPEPEPKLEPSPTAAPKRRAPRDVALMAAPKPEPPVETPPPAPPSEPSGPPPTAAFPTP